MMGDSLHFGQLELTYSLARIVKETSTHQVYTRLDSVELEYMNHVTLDTHLDKMLSSITLIFITEYN